MMKLAISVMTAISLSLTSTALADHNNDLVVQGYRWVTAEGPYICHAEEDVRQLVAHRTDATELQAVENVHCHYLIPGTVVQVITQDPAKGMSQIWVGGITTPLWTYTRFVSKHPVRDTYGNIEMPEERGLTPKAQMQLAPPPSDNSAARTRMNDDLSSFGLLGPDDREIDLGLHGDVKIIRQDLDHHVRNDFGNLRLRKPSLLYLVEIGVTDVTTFLQ